MLAETDYREERTFRGGKRSPEASFFICLSAMGRMHCCSRHTLLVFYIDDFRPIVFVRLEHSHSFIDSLDNHSTASGPASCRGRIHPGNAVSGHSSTMCLVVWWLSPHGQAGDVITPHR